MKSLDLRSMLLAKHAQHVVLIHFPIALCLVGIFFDFLYQWTRKREFEVVSYYNLSVAALFTIPVLATGLLAWHWQLEGQALKGKLLLHLVLGFASSSLLWVIWAVHYRARSAPRSVLPLYRLPVEVLGAMVIALTAHLGGFLSGVNVPR